MDIIIDIRLLREIDQKEIYRELELICVKIEKATINGKRIAGICRAQLKEDKANGND